MRKVLFLIKKEPSIQSRAASASVKSKGVLGYTTRKGEVDGGISSDSGTSQFGLSLVYTVRASLTSTLC